jgi:polysaccharide export outer membrane protein
VIIFPGDPGTAKVIPLTNNNTTLMEVLAVAGGITQEGKAYQIKLIRGNPNNPDVYLIDLSKIGGIKEGNTILQEGDIIYVTPVIQPEVQFVNKLSPTLTLLSTLLLAITLYQSVSKL